MKSRKKRTARITLAGIIVLLTGLATLAVDYARFPGKIKDGAYQNQVVTAGRKSSFRQGFAYRYPDLPPLVEVSGDPYEMGLQYGVLLRSEIVATLNSLGLFLRGQAKQAHIPYFLMTAAMRFKAGQMVHRLPRRYAAEMRGVADGAGILASTAATVSLMYDIYQSMMACTGILMKGRHGSIIQGRLNDMGAFGGISQIAAIVRHRPKGLNSFVHMDVPLYLGVETGLSEKGLSCGGETLRVKKPDRHGFSHPFLMRMILEEAGSLEEIYPFLDRYHQVGADGVVWADLAHSRGAVVEITPTAWAKRELEGPILWDFNRFYDESLARQQSPAYNIIGGNIDREAIASAFPKKIEYTVEDAMDFLRNQTGPDGTNYAWSGTKLPVCNRMTTQMMIFDSASDGFYLAMGPSFASRRTIWHVFGDFSKQPEVFALSASVHPLAEKAAGVENSAPTDEGKLEALIALANGHAEDANAQFLVAYTAFRLSRPGVFSQFAAKALDGKPAEPEYQLFAGLAAYQQKNLDRAIALLESAAARYPEQEIFKLAVLERAWAKKDAPKAGTFRAEKQALLVRHGVQGYFKKKLQPLLDALEKEK